MKSRHAPILAIGPLTPKLAPSHAASGGSHAALAAAYAAAFAKLPDGSATAPGVTLGQQTAQAFPAARASDGSADAQGP